jgi:plasmid stabilization system protein ParE
VKQQFGPAARLELIEATQWYLDEGSPALAGRFERDIGRAMQLLAVMPGIGSPNYPGVRTWPLKDFPYTLVYRVVGDTLTVMAVAHQSRAPGYWRGRG